jgi:hypothetical protein
MVCATLLVLPGKSQAFNRRSRNACTPVPACVCPTLGLTAYSAPVPITGQVVVAKSAFYDSRNDLVICGNQPVPPGWVIVGLTTVFSCGGTGNNNAMIIRKL